MQSSVINSTIVLFFSALTALLTSQNLSISISIIYFFKNLLTFQLFQQEIKTIVQQSTNTKRKELSNKKDILNIFQDRLADFRCETLNGDLYILHLDCKYKSLCLNTCIPNYCNFGNLDIIH